MNEKAPCAQRLKHILSVRNLRQSDLCSMTGIPKSAMSQYIKGNFEPKQDRVELLAKALNVSEAWLMGFDVPMERQSSPASISKNVAEFPSIDNILPLPQTCNVPLLGTIACGNPVLAEENIIDFVPVPDCVKNADFALRCQGDSMTGARIFDGDIVYIRQQPEVENGQIAAVLIDNEATLKRVYRYPNKIVLNPENPAYEPLVFTNEELVSLRILGKAVAFLSKI